MTRLIAFAALVAFAGGFGLRRLCVSPPVPPPNHEAPDARAEVPLITAMVNTPGSPGSPESPLAGAWPEAAVERLEAKDARGFAVALLRWLKGADGETLRMAMERIAKREGKETLVTMAENEGLSRGLLAACFARWGELSPAEALATLSEMGGVGTDYHPAAYASWLKFDSAAAMAHAEADPARRHDESMAGFCRRFLAPRHPEFDLGWALGNGVPAEWFARLWLARGIDPESLLAGLGQLDANARTEVTGAVFFPLFASLDERIATNPVWLELYLTAQREEIPHFWNTVSFVQAQAHANPMATLSWMEAVDKRGHFSTDEESRSPRRSFLDQARLLGQRLCVNGSDSAFATARALPEGELRESVMKGIVEGIMERDPEAARALLALDDVGDDLRVELAPRLFSQEILRMRPDEIIGRLNAMPEGAERERHAEAVAENNAIAPEDRVAVLESAFHGSPEILGGHAMGVVHAWADSEPVKAAAWLAGFADNEYYPEVVSIVAERWADQDINAAAAWVRDLPAGPVRDAGAGILIPRARESDPHTALEWAATLGDPAERANQLAHAVRAVDTYASEPDEARAALEALPVTALERSELLRVLEGSNE